MSMADKLFYAAAGVAVFAAGGLFSIAGLLIVNGLTGWRQVIEPAAARSTAAESTAFDLSQEDFKRIETALVLMQEIDAEHHFRDEAEKTQQLLARMRALAVRRVFPVGG
jgi:hypothetical protein